MTAASGGLRYDEGIEKIKSTESASGTDGAGTGQGRMR